MVCPKCGEKNEEKVKFCASCGENLENSISSETIDISDIVEDVKNNNDTQNNIKETSEIEDNANKQDSGNIEPMVVEVNDKELDKNVEERKKEDKLNVVDKLKRVDKKYFLGAIILLIVIIVFVIVIKSCGKNDIKNIEDINKTTAFFIKNNDGKYAMFNEDGKQLTDFKFKDVKNTFINGTTVVENEEKEKAIINDEGKYVVEFGKYKYIYAKGGLYKVTDSEYNSYLLNSQGKQIEKLNKQELLDYVGESSYSILKGEKEYTVYSYMGDSIVTFELNEKEDDEPKVNSRDEFVSIFYDNNNYIINTLTGKKITSFSSEQHFCVGEVNEDDKSQIILRTCTDWATKLDNKSFKLLKDDKIVYEKDDKECNNVYLKGKHVVCASNDGKFILDSKGNKTINISDKAYVDSENYVVKGGNSFNGVEFYVNGKLKKQVECLTLKNSDYYNESGIYKLGTYYSTKCETTSGIYKLFNEDGSLLTEDEYRSVTNFDSNGLAIASLDKENYYLINKKGKKVGNEYKDIDSTSHEFYIAKISSDEKVLLDIDGKEIIKGETITLTKRNDKVYSLIKKGDNEYVVFDLDKKKEITKLEAKPQFYDNYFTVIDGDHTKYYSYTKGTSFFEV